MAGRRTKATLLNELKEIVKNIGLSKEDIEDYTDLFDGFLKDLERKKADKRFALEKKKK